MHAWLRFEVLQRVLMLCLALGVLQPAWAHKASDAYLFLDSQAGRTTLRWDIALRDLDAALPVDANSNGEITWAEVRAAWPAIEALALPALQVPGCQFQPTGRALERRQDGAYAVLLLAASCQVADDAAIRYRLFADVDPTHRGILRWQRTGGGTQVRLLDPTATGPDAAMAPAATAPASFLREGVHHIVTGYDHLLFLLCLLLPAVLRREGQGWQAVQGWRAAVWPVLKTVTLFTVAHSVTLALASLKLVTLPGWFVEPAIAATIMLAALDNIRPFIGAYRGWVTFGFGLIHGFGFAGVLGELDLPASTFGWALFQFNLGLEAGQLVIVAAVVPVLYLLRRARLYVPGVMVAGSGAAIVLAGVWLVERTGDLSLLPF